MDRHALPEPCRTMAFNKSLSVSLLYTWYTTERQEAKQAKPIQS